LALVVHIPFLSSLSQINKGAMEPNTEGLVVSNSREILDLFNRYNLKLVLQGHLHVLEDNYIKGIHFITGGAICGGWWKGPHEGTQEGFLYLKFNRDSFTWNYVDYNWAPELTIKPQP
jgi:3',5'-cyclic-AMP phosphodiesterase